jgi:hydrogenase expression/formation protein HypC
MCLAVPAEVIALLPEQDSAVVSLGGVRKQISLALVEDVALGDFVLVHVGFALAKVNKDEAARTLELMVEAGVIKLEPKDSMSAH